jgi:hypothetical protein
MERAVKNLLVRLSSLFHLSAGISLSWGSSSLGEPQVGRSVAMEMCLFRGSAGERCFGLFGRVLRSLFLLRLKTSPRHYRYRI